MRCTCPEHGGLDSDNPGWYRCGHLAKVDRYIVTSHETKGGKAGEVWKARDNHFREGLRPVAIKIVNVPAGGERSLETEIFRLVDVKKRDDQILIPTLYDHRWMEPGTSSGGLRRYWLAMQHIDGPDLSEHHAKAEAGSIADSLELVRSLLETLVKIHAQQVAHGDPRSCNLIRARDNDKLYVIDFGDAESYDVKMEWDLQIAARVACQFLSPRSARAGRGRPAVLYSADDIHPGVAPGIKSLLKKACRQPYTDARVMLHEFRAEVRKWTAFTPDPARDWHARLKRWCREGLIPEAAYYLAEMAGSTSADDGKGAVKADKTNEKPAWWGKVGKVAQEAAWLTDDKPGAATFATQLAEALGRRPGSSTPPSGSPR
jgi:hypothetical protein